MLTNNTQHTNADENITNSIPDANTDCTRPKHMSVVSDTSTGKGKTHRRKGPKGSVHRPAKGSGNIDMSCEVNEDVSLSQRSKSGTSTELSVTTSAVSESHGEGRTVNTNMCDLSTGVHNHNNMKVGDDDLLHLAQYSTVFINRYLIACREMHTVPSESVIAAGKCICYNVRDICVAYGGGRVGESGDMSPIATDHSEKGLHTILRGEYTALSSRLNNGSDEYDMRHLADFINKRQYNPINVGNIPIGASTANTTATDSSHMVDTKYSTGEDVILCFILSNVTLGNRGALALGTALQGIPFRIISISECFLQDCGCESIADAIVQDGTLCSSLVELDLRGNAIRDGRPLATVLVACQLLKSLRLGWNKIGICGSSAQVLLSAATTHRSLHMLDLSNCMLGGDSLLSIIQLIIAQSKTLTHLNISYNSLGTGGGGAAIHGALLRNNILRLFNVSGNGFGRRETEGIESKLATNERNFLDFEARERQSCSLAAKVKDLENKFKSLSTTCDMLRETNKMLEETNKCLLLDKETFIRRSTSEKEDLSNKITEMERHVVELEQKARVAMLEADDRLADHRRIADEAVSQSRQREIELNVMVRKSQETDNTNSAATAGLKREILALNEQIGSLTGSLKQSSSDYSEAVKEIAEKRQELVKLQTDLLLANEEKSRRVSEVSVRCGEIRVLEERVRDLQSENASLQDHVRQLNEKAMQWKLEKEEAFAVHGKELQSMRDDYNRRVERIIEEHTHSTKLLRNTLDNTKQALTDRTEDANRERENLLQDIHNLRIVESEKQTVMLELQAAKQEKRKAESNEHIGAQRIKVMHEEMKKMQTEQQQKVDLIESQYSDEITRLQEQLLSKATELQVMENEVIKVRSQLRSVEENKQRDSEALEQRLMNTLRGALHPVIGTGEVEAFRPLSILGHAVPLGSKSS